MDIAAKEELKLNDVAWSKILRAKAAIQQQQQQQQQQTEGTFAFVWTPISSTSPTNTNTNVTVTQPVGHEMKHPGMGATHPSGGEEGGAVPSVLDTAAKSGIDIKMGGKMQKQVVKDGSNGLETESSTAADKKQETSENANPNTASVSLSLCPSLSLSLFLFLFLFLLLL
jgi:hypothetical protein